MSKANKCGQRLGWFSAGMLCLMLSFPSWGLDLNHHDNYRTQIALADASSAQIASTLGRGQRVGIHTSAQTQRLVKVRLVRKAKGRHRR